MRIAERIAEMIVLWLVPLFVGALMVLGLATEPPAELPVTTSTTTSTVALTTTTTTTTTSTTEAPTGPRVEFPLTATFIDPDTGEEVAVTQLGPTEERGPWRCIVNGHEMVVGGAKPETFGDAECWLEGTR
jgi:hypothetical protein